MAATINEIEVFPENDEIEVFPAEETPSLRPEIPSPFGAQPSSEAPRKTPENALELQQFLINQERDILSERAQEREPNKLTPEQTRRLDEGSIAENLMAPLPGLEAPMVTGADVLKKFPGMTEGNAKIVAGVLQTAASAWNFAASPFGAATMPVAALAGAPGLAGVAGKAVLGTFAVEALEAMPEAANQMNAALTSGDPERIAQAGTQLGMTMGVMFGAGKGAASGFKTQPVVESVLERGKASGMERSSATVEQISGRSQPAQALGIVPKETTALQKAIDFFTPPEPVSVPEIRIEKDARLPRLQPYETEKLLASSPEGMARVPVLGALMDPRATAKAAPDVPIITRAYSVHKGRTFAAMWGESQFRNKDLFKADPDTGTISLTNGERGYMSDVIEAEMRDPGSQSITPAQRAWINEEWKPLREDVNKMLEEEGVREIVTEDMSFNRDDYFPRPAIGKRNRSEATPKGQTGGRPGSQPFFEKSRKFPTEFEGARPSEGGKLKEEIIYDPDGISRAMKFIMGAYRAVADHRLANDVKLGGQTVAERFEVLKEKHGDRLALLDEAERGEFESQLREQAAYPIWGKEEALNIAPAFTGRIYPVESANKLRKAYAEDVRGWVRTASTLTGAAKGMMATMDMSAPLVQGAAMFGRHPVRWAKATANSYRALLDPSVMGRMLEKPKYKTAAEEFTQSGGSLLQLEDFLSGMKEGGPATKVPGVGRVVKMTGRAYGVFLDAAKLELWDAWSKGVPKSEWGKVAEAIENSLFMGRMEKIGLNPHRAIGERLMAFAPAYYRGAGGLISTALQRGVSGKIARNMIGGYAAAGALVTVGALLAMDTPWEEIERRLDPTKGTFMKVPIETGDGKRVEVGIGNVLTQLVRLSGQAVDYHTSDKPIDTGVENNPYLRFLRGRSALLPSLGIEIATGRDYFGNRIEIKEAIARRFMPFALQSMFPREESSKGQRVMDSAFSFFGLNAFPESEYAAQLRKLDEASRDKNGKPFLELPLNERALAVKEFKERPDFKKREPTVTDMERFVHINEQREKSLKGRLNEKTRERLDSLGLSTGGYKSSVTVKGVDVPLSHAEQVRYEELLAEEYDRTVKDLPTAMEGLPPNKRDEWWGKYRQQIGESARRKLMTEMLE